MTLVRGRGKPITSRTVDVGRGGMRVLREDVGSTYALRFEPLGARTSDALGRLLGGAGL